MNTPPRHRLFVEADLAADAVVALGRDQAHYLLHVLRLGIGDAVLVFNGRDGEYSARIAATAKKSADLAILRQTRPQPVLPTLMLAFAPVKRARIDFMAEKATELGVGLIQPMITEFTAVSRVNTDRLRANAIEAAEQTGRMTIPVIEEPKPLMRLLEDWPGPRHIIFCDEGLAGSQPDAMVDRIQAIAGPAAILIGPEGGFSPAERAALNAREDAVPVSLGPNILRADTAMVAAVSIWQAVAGAWRKPDGAQ